MCIQFLQDHKSTYSEHYRAQGALALQTVLHVFPRKSSLVLVEENNQRIFKAMEYGLIPYFENNEKPKSVFHNARIETAFEKPSFKDVIITQRCLVPMTSFFEYVDRNGRKQLLRFFTENSTPLTAAGIWRVWISPTGVAHTTYAALTTEPDAFILESGHDRSPIFLKPEAFDEWLSTKKKTKQELLRILNQKETVQFFAEDLTLPTRKKENPKPAQLKLF